MQPIIKVEHLGKKYIIRHEHPERYVALRDVLTQKAKKLFSFPAKLRPKTQATDYEEFWALKDLNFEIQQGDRVGIIGRNGAGKSTLLKILSRITEPSTGRITLNGRVASLLEVGTGFHPELTGRENIFLNGAILGMSRVDIRRKFDEIVDFSGVEKFLDTPVKRYSSGMYVRLAFAVAAHLEPEILVVDEVLAVGDAEFQKKCLGKMEDVSKNEGRTVLFVSHNLSAITLLCNKGVFLKEGMIVEENEINIVVNQYLSTNLDTNNEQIWTKKNRPGNKIVRLISVKVIDTSLLSKGIYLTNEDIGIEIKYEVLQNNYILWLGCNVHNAEGVNIFDTHSVSSEYYIKPHTLGVYKSTTWIPRNLLAEGIFTVGIAIFNHKEQVVHVHEKEIVFFKIIEDINSLTARGQSVGTFPGVIRPLLKWEIKQSKNH